MSTAALSIDLDAIAANWRALDAANTGETAAVVDYDYTLEFARSLQIASPQASGEPADELQQDLEELERFRQYRY